MTQTIRDMIERRSCKAYLDKMPEREKLDAIIEAGLYAASGRNRQPAIILAVTDKALRDKLSAMNAEILGAQTDPFYNAPVVFVVLADASVNTAVYDGSLVMGNLMLAAHSLGLGSCWVQIHLRKSKLGKSSEDLLRLTQRPG